MADTLIATSDVIDGCRVKSYLGLIASRAFMLDACLSNKKFLDDFQSTVKSAETDLKKSACSIGANAVVGVKTEYFKNCGGTILVLTGTAVILESL